MFVYTPGNTYINYTSRYERIRRGKEQINDEDVKQIEELTGYTLDDDTTFAQVKTIDKLLQLAKKFANQHNFQESVRIKNLIHLVKMKKWRLKKNIGKNEL